MSPHHGSKLPDASLQPLKLMITCSIPDQSRITTQEPDQTRAASYSQPEPIVAGRGLMWMMALLLSGLISLPAQAATHNSNGSASDVQSKINSASTGDTVTIPSGTFTWSATVTIPSTKGITLQGAGETQTTIIRGVSGSVQTLSVTCGPTTRGVRITGIKWVDRHASEKPGSAGHIGIGGGPTTAKFRIDHCTFDNSATEGLKHAIQVFNSQFGVIDHCTFLSGSNTEHIHNHGRSPPYSKDGAPDWTNDVFPGSDQALYIEDCKFINTDTPNGHSSGAMQRCKTITDRASSSGTTNLI